MKQLPGAVQGAIWMLSSCIFYAAAASLVREVGDTYTSYQMTMIRSLVAVVALAPLYLSEGGKLLFMPKRFFMHFLTGVFTYLGIVFWFMATASMPIADFFALQFVTPLLTMAFAIFFLREKADMRSWIAALIGFAGVLVILRPGIIDISFAAMAALISAVFYASDNTVIKSLTKGASATMIVFYAHLLMIPISIPMAVVTWKQPTLYDFGIIVVLCLCLTMAYLSVAKAVSLTVARVIQPVNFMRMPIAAVFGWVLFSEFPDIWTWAGAIIIFCSTTYAVRRGAKTPEKSAAA
jgi:drug/metabolite transporter (DMT)-like permease